MSEKSQIVFPVETVLEPRDAGVYFFRGEMKDESGGNEFEGWVDYSSSGSCWLFGNEQSFGLENFKGEWFGPFEMEFV